MDYEQDLVVLLQPTSPIRTGIQVDEAIRIIQNKTECNSVVSVIRMDDIHPARMYWMNSDHTKMDSILSDYETARRQDIPPAFYRNGAIYIARAKNILEECSMIISPTFGYEMNSQSWLNIDDKRDVIIANSLLKAWKKGFLG
jgi:CMP-N-acetylneuraminic acid synthetase